MFNERKIICLHLLVFLIFPIMNRKKDKEILLPLIVCTCLLFIFPFLSTELKDSIFLV